jgi:RNA polymerase sigma-70 factor (ECF subfamily)
VGPFSLDAAAEAAILAAARGRAAARAQAFEALFRALREPVLALALHLTGRRADAEDALQETFLDVHRGLERFRGEARLSTWVYRIAVRAALRMRARRGDLAATRVPEGRGAGPEGVEQGAEGDDPGGGGEEALLARLEARRVAAALDRLPAEQRAVLSLFALRGLSHLEVAEILGVPEGTVWSRLHAARQRLAAEVGREPAAGAAR